MNWMYLFIAGIFEIFSILIMKKASGKKGGVFFLWFLFMMGIFGISLWFLSLAMQKIDMSVAYAVWTGIGTVGGVIMARVVYFEKISLLKWFCLFVIVASVIGLKLLQ